MSIISKNKSIMHVILSEVCNYYYEDITASDRFKRAPVPSASVNVMTWYECHENDGCYEEISRVGRPVLPMMSNKWE